SARSRARLRPRSVRRSARVATRSARRSRALTGRTSEPRSCRGASWTSGKRPNERSVRPASPGSTGSTSAPHVTRRYAARAAETASREACKAWSRVSADEIRARYETIRNEVGEAVTVVAATKYVSVEEMAVLAEAGIEVVGENRAQDLEAKHAVFGAALFSWARAADHVTIAAMGLEQLWTRTLVYFGIAEEDEDFYEDEETYAAEESLEQSYRDRPNVRRLTPRRRSQEFDDWTESSEAERSPRRSAPRAVPLQAVQDPNAVRVHLVLPRSFNDA